MTVKRSKRWWLDLADAEAGSFIGAGRHLSSALLAAERPKLVSIASSTPVEATSPDAIDRSAVEPERPRAARRAAG
jgi:hypothetical protein